MELQLAFLLLTTAATGTTALAWRGWGHRHRHPAG